MSPSALHYQAAAEFAKTHLPEALRQQLLTYEREKEQDREKDKEKDEKRERISLSYPSILEQQILTLDREILEKLSAAYNEAGAYLPVHVTSHMIRSANMPTFCPFLLLLFRCYICSVASNYQNTRIQYFRLHVQPQN